MRVEIKKYLLFILFFIGCGTLGYSQKTLLKVNLYTWIEYGDPEVYMEFNLDEKSSIDASLRLGFGSTPFSNRIDFNIDLKAAYRYYLLHKKFKTPTGLFLRPVIGFSTLPPMSNTAAFGARYNNFQAGATAGFQYIIRKKFSIDLFAGEAYYFSLNDDFESRFRPVYNIGIGYGF